jgi:hypothetical protein
VKSSKPSPVLPAVILWELSGSESLILAVTYCRPAAAAVAAARIIDEPARLPLAPDEPHTGAV